MANVAIYEKGSDTIQYFIRDCVQHGRSFRGSNGSVTGIKEHIWDIIWTDDIATSTNDVWDKKPSDLTPCDPGAVVVKTDKTEYENAVRRRAELASMSYDQVETYIDNNVADLASARAYLKKLSKIVLAIIKMQER